MVDLQQVINSSLSLRLASALARKFSPQIGYRVGDYIADQIAHQNKSRLVQAVRANQWVIHGECLDKNALHRAVQQSFRFTAHCIFDLYHYIEDLNATRQLIVLNPVLQQIAQRPEFADRGLLIVGLHLSNFDLVLQWLCKQGMKLLVLTIPDPEGGRRMEYEIRKKTGVNVIPASVGALRQALKHLKQGGMVLTGMDRPVPNPGVCPHFFGRPAALPMHHIFLATKAEVPLVIAATNLQPDGKYHTFTSDFIEMEDASEAGMLRNAENVLNIAEKFIRQAPAQWSVPLPVWPEIMHLVPK